jgi:hypothetical protein
MIDLYHHGSSVCPVFVTAVILCIAGGVEDKDYSNTK